MKMKWQGKMELVEQEGGYCSPQLWVGETNITSIVDELLGGGEELFKIEGEWQLTLERIKK